MNLIVPRTCTDVAAAGDDRPREAASSPLASYRDVPAYVLLGDPGAGKTTAFQTECEALGDQAHSITARDFTTFDPDDYPEWRDKTLFIDGLDEVRAGTPDARTSFDAIRARLDKLGRPRFRLSCRHADWLGANDRGRLASVSPHGSQVTVLGLDPLSETDVERIVDARTGIHDATDFIQKAREIGIAALLENPQSLLLLADVMDKEGAWPTSRLGLFDKACVLTIRETNEEHSIAEHQPPTSEFLDAAGRLCAVLIITGAVGYALDPSHADGAYLIPEQCGCSCIELVERALATKLFTAESQGRFIPVHRHIAEFLGAKHLAGLIGNGLPAGRAVALLTGYDGGVVTNLRGLTAWLAALSESARRELITRDPIGVVSYGDVLHFAVEDKRLLLEALSREASRIYSHEWTGWAIGAVVTPGMESVFQTTLQSHDKAEFALIQLVLLALQHGSPLNGIVDALLKIVYDESCVLNHAWMALEAFIHNCLDEAVVTQRLMRLLKDISDGKLTDYGNNLTAIALTHLYPLALSPSKIWNYLTDSASQHAAYYRRFWCTDLIERSTEEDVAELLDGLSSRGCSLKAALQNHHLEEAVVKLLARGIESWGNTISISRLFAWLRVDMFPRSTWTSEEATRRIGAWFEQRPEMQKVIVSEYVNRSIGVPLVSGICELLHTTSLFSDFGIWCLHQARAAKDRRIVEFYLTQARDRGVPLEVLLERTNDTNLLKDVMGGLLVSPLRKGYFDSLRRRQVCWENREQKRLGFVEFVRPHVDALNENRGDGQLLDQLAMAYFGLFSDVDGDNPRQRIRSLFDDERDLVDAAFAGLRRTPLRVDVPDPRDIVSRAATNKEYMIARPFLAGLDEMDDLDQLNDRQLKQACAFQFCTLTNGTDRDREHRLLQFAPRIAAEVLVQYVRAKMRAGVYGDRIAERLADDEYAIVARHAALPLLRSFPVRCGQPQGLVVLDELLRAAILYERTAALNLIGEKLSRTTMRDPQRVHWLASGAVTDPDGYLGRLQEFVGRHERRISTLENYVCRYKAQPADQQPTRMLEWLIELFGSSVARPESAPSARPSLRDPASQVHTMVRALADRPDRQVSDALARLVSSPNLQSWRRYLTDALERHRVLRRDAEYRHPTVADVCTTLSGGTPANAGDLAALLIDRLLELARGIRDGNTDDWRQFWNVDPYGKPLQPRPENICRDALLSDLKRLLPMSVNARREGSYAADKRADVVVACADFEVPMEIKRNGHQDLWSAAHNQLIAKYARDPATGGHGIYLVLWFGKDDTQAPPIGPPPTSPDELQARLEETLSDAERHKISVVVIDVSRPE